MAQKVSVLLVDDIDGSAAGETISFGVDGTRYEIDLNGAHARELRQQLERFVKAARQVTGSSGRPARVRRASADDRNKEVRHWARDQGLEVNDRGRIPAHIVAQYEAENGKQLTPSIGSRLGALSSLLIRVPLPTGNPSESPRGRQRITDVPPAEYPDGIAVRVLR